MTAKEMFSRLGYKMINNRSNIITYELEIFDTFKQTLGIQFVLNHNVISIYRKIGTDFNYGAFNDLDMETLKAINEQCEELGWI